VLGVAFLGGLGYAEATATVESDYAEYSANCDDLANQSRLVDAGLCMERVELNETDVRRCENSSFTEYRSARYRSFGATPLNVGQWLLFGGLGGVLALGGSTVLRQELR
jgi:hypothetical protein